MFAELLRTDFEDESEGKHADQGQGEGEREVTTEVWKGEGDNKYEVEGSETDFFTTCAIKMV